MYFYLGKKEDKIRRLYLLLTRKGKQLWQMLCESSSSSPGVQPELLQGRVGFLE